MTPSGISSFRSIPSDTETGQIEEKLTTPQTCERIIESGYNFKSVELTYILKSNTFIPLRNSLIKPPGKALSISQYIKSFGVWCGCGDSLTLVRRKLHVLRQMYSLSLCCL